MAAVDQRSLSAKQTLFLDAYRDVGTLRKAAALAHVGRSTVDSWLDGNVNGFRELFEEAREDFADSVEDIMFSLLPEMKVGNNPTLIIFALKALRPNKYRELTIIPDEHARELLKRLEQWRPPAESKGDDRPESQLTPMEQVEKLLRGG